MGLIVLLLYFQIDSTPTQDGSHLYNTVKHNYLKRHVPCLIVIVLVQEGDIDRVHEDGSGSEQ